MGAGKILTALPEPPAAAVPAVQYILHGAQHLRGLTAGEGIRKACLSRDDGHSLHIGGGLAGPGGHHPVAEVATDTSLTFKRRSMMTVASATVMEAPEWNTICFCSL